MADIPPAWHPDPTGRHDHRWWDGQRWTEHVADAGVAAVDPLPDAGGEQDATAGDAATSGGGAATAGGAAAAAGGAGAAADPRQVDTDQGGQAAGAGVGEPSAPRDASEPTWTSSGGREAQPAWPGPGATSQPQPGDGGASPDPSTRPGEPGAVWAQAAETRPAADPTKPSGLAITALVLGVLSIPTGILALGGILAIAAIVCGAIAAGKAKRGEAGGRGLAIGGIITGITGLLVAAIAFVAFMSVAGSAMECLERTNDPALCQRELERELLQRWG